MTIDRDALIDAAARALVDVESNGLCGKAWPGPCDMCDCGLDGMSAEDAERGESACRDRDRVRHVLDAVLPLIADAIDRGVEPDPLGDWSRGMLAAARLVRSLARPGTGE